MASTAGLILLLTILETMCPACAVGGASKLSVRILGPGDSTGKSWSPAGTSVPCRSLWPPASVTPRYLTSGPSVQDTNPTVGVVPKFPWPGSPALSASLLLAGSRPVLHLLPVSPLPRDTGSHPQGLALLRPLGSVARFLSAREVPALNTPVRKLCGV